MLHAAAILTSTLALFGVLPTINVLVWEYGVMWLGGIFLFISFVFKMLAFDSAYKNLDNLKYGVTATVAYGTIKSDFSETLAVTAATVLPLVI